MKKKPKDRTKELSESYYKFKAVLYSEQLWALTDKDFILEWYEGYVGDLLFDQDHYFNFYSLN